MKKSIVFLFASLIILSSVSFAAAAEEFVVAPLLNTKGNACANNPNAIQAPAIFGDNKCFIPATSLGIEIPSTATNQDGEGDIFGDYVLGDYAAQGDSDYTAIWIISIPE